MRLNLKGKAHADRRIVRQRDFDTMVNTNSKMKYHRPGKQDPKGEHTANKSFEAWKAKQEA